MKILNELFYTKNHEWVRVEGDKAYIGVTDYAQKHLGNIVFVELPEEGDEIGANDSLAAVESVKAASDVYTPISGEVAEINTELEDDPGLLNKDPYGNWVAAINMSNKDELKELLSPEDYEKVCKEA
jgi:glycine cleavage system H protein